MGKGQTNGHVVGRVGALAVALGVGGAIFALPAVAAADRGGAADTSAGAPAESPAESPASLTDSPTASGPGSAPAGRPSRGAVRPSRDDAPPAPRSGRNWTPPAPAAKRAGHVPVLTTPTPPPVSDLPQTAAPQPAAATGSAVALNDSTPTLPSDRSVPVALPALALPPVASPVTLSVPVAPVLTSAAPRGALVAPGRTLLAWLGGSGDPLAPAATPLGWAALALSRRELSGAARTAAPAASVTTAAPAAAVTGPLNQPGVITALVGAAKQVIIQAAGGGDLGAALHTALAALDTNPALANISLETVLRDPALPQSMGSTAAALVTGLAADSAVRDAVGAAIGESVAASLGQYGFAQKIGATVGDAVAGLLADARVGKALGAVANTFVSVVLAQPGVSAVATDVARQLYAGLNGPDPSAALDAAGQALQSSSVFTSAVAGSAGAAVKAILGDAGMVAALGEATTSLVSQLPGVPGVATVVGAVLGPYSGAVLSMLADPAATQTLAALAGSLVTDFVAHPGVVDALASAADQVAAVAIDGTDLFGSLVDTLKSLQANPAVASALDAAISQALHVILSDSATEGTVGDLARGVIVGYVAGAVGNVPLVGKVAVDVTSAAVDSLLSNSTFGDLISTVAGDLVGGTPTPQAVQNAIAAVVADRDLQAAIGQAVGQAIGALLGDNPIGAFVGKVAGATATAVIGLVCRFAALLNAVPAAASVDNRKSGYWDLVTV